MTVPAELIVTGLAKGGVLLREGALQDWGHIQRGNSRILGNQTMLDA
jgi:hypothetical protein